MAPAAVGRLQPGDRPAAFCACHLGSEAERIGLVDYALPAEEVLSAAVEYATTLAERCSPTAMATIKAQLRRDASTSFDAASDAAFALMLEAFEHPDQAEGATAFQERRLPRFATPR